MVSGLVVGVLAVIVLVGFSPLEPGITTLLAVAAGLGAPLSYAVAGNFVRARLGGVEPLELATGMLVAGTLVALPVAILSGAPGVPAMDGLVSLIAVGTLSTAVAWPIFFRVLRRTTPTAASTVTFVVPAFALTWGSIVLAEPIGVGLVVGFGLILLSLVLVLGHRPRAAAAVPRPRAGLDDGARRLGPAAATRPARLRSGGEVPILHLPRVIHGVVGRATHEELDRPRAGRLALRVVGTDGVQVRLPMRRQAIGREHDVERSPDLDLPRELVRLREVDVADDLVPGPPAATRAGAELVGDAGRGVVEIRPARLQEVQAALEVR